jgi:2-hydroxy-4-carboxymuconate semialdehyde hemiacetal dehydrogenase
VKICIAGQGAFGVKHIEAIQKIPGIEIVTLAGGSADSTAEVAKKFGIPHWSLDLAECLARPGVTAAILATPTQMHAKQGIQCMRAGKHVQIEIPIADNLRDAEELARVQKETGLICMGGHTRRFNPSHQWVGAQEDPRGRDQRPADGRADLLLPPHQHECARQAAQLD